MVRSMQVVQVQSATVSQLVRDGKGSCPTGTWLQSRLVQATLAVAEELAGFAHTCLQLFWFPWDVSQQLQVHLPPPPPLLCLP